jgi:hypothetical protein
VDGLPTALSVIVSVAVRVPLAVGSKKTPIEQLAPATKLLPHEFSTPKSLELVATFEIVSAVLPALVTVTVCGSPLVPTYWLGNVIVLGDTVPPAPEVLPLSATVCGLPIAESAILTFAVNVPTLVGANVTET